MNFLDFFTTTLPAFLFVLGLVVVVHELGHFLAAKAVGIRVEQFSIGYPPRMIGKRIGDTDYCLSWIPLGGYVKMAGMIDESMDNPEKITGAPDEFMSKKTWQKVLVITAGVIMNFILAIVIFTGVTMVEGVPEVKDAIVEAVSAGMPAEAAGLKPGDRIISVDGVTVTDWQGLVAHIHSHPEQEIQLTWLRLPEGAPEGAEPLGMTASLIPKRDKTLVAGEIKEVGLIGISPRATFRPVGPGAAVVAGVTLTGRNIQLGIDTIRMLFTGQATVKDLGGPIAIAKWSGDSARGGFTSLILFVAFISINIGFLNILPIPVLDGGHLVLVLWEGITRRPISTRVKLGIQQVGMVLMLMLMVVVIFNDIGRVGLFDKIRGMF